MRKNEAEETVKKIVYGHYLGFKITEHNNDNAHSLREMNTQGRQKRPPVNNKLITSVYELCPG